MLYLPRLFVHHAESAPVGGEADLLFRKMEEKLLRVIMNPAMIMAWICGILLAVTPGTLDWAAIWPWTKLVSILGMSGFHGWLSKQRKVFAAGDNKLEGRTYRIMNEVPTVLMIVIVISVIARPF